MSENKKKITIITILVLAITIVVFITIALICRKQSINNLTEFEKNAIYSYFENTLPIEKIYLLSGKMQYNETQYIQSQIKEIADSIYKEKQEKKISIDDIKNELFGKYDISETNIDFRSIVISDYEYSEKENAFIRKVGANSRISSTESEINMIKYNEAINVLKIEKISKNSYNIYFNIVDKNNKEISKESGIATIKVEKNSYTIEKVSME